VGGVQRDPGRRWRPWRAAMAEALYGERGFYRASGTPRRHFRTAAHASSLWAHALHELAARVDRSLGCPEAFTVVDVGAGGGELVAGVAALAPSRWRLVGVDVAPRPDALPRRVDWLATLPAGVEGVLLAVECLDVVPVDVVELGPDGARLVEVADDGDERLGTSPSTQDMEWLLRWWPLREVGDRAEVGRPRDEAWAAAFGSLARGVALAVDYAAVPGRDVAGTLTGYREGRQLLPVPDGSCDLTAHVLVESCAAAVDATHTAQLTQREALQQLGLTGERPAYDGDPQSYLTGLSAAGEVAELTDRGGLGAFTWLLQSKGVALPL
jgi:SAM-dependent MidA family methyltransferase